MFFLCVCVLIADAASHFTRNWNVVLTEGRLEPVDVFCSAVVMGASAKVKHRGTVYRRGKTGGLFRNCCHINLQGVEAKVWPRCIQINHRKDVPCDVLNAWPFVRVRRALCYSVMDSRSHRLPFEIDRCRLCNVVNSTVDMTASYYPFIKAGCNGVTVAYVKPLTYDAYVLSKDANGWRVCSTQPMQRDHVIFSVYSTGNVVMSLFHQEALGEIVSRLHKWHDQGLC